MEAVKYVTQDGIVRTQAVASWGLDRVSQRNLPLDGTADFTGKTVNQFLCLESRYLSNRGMPTNVVIFTVI